MSKAWGDCPRCHQYMLHFIRKIRDFQNITRPSLEPIMTNAFEDPQFHMRWHPGKRTTGRRMLRECRECEGKWWEVLEQKTEDA